jgi:hypothetical protein
VDSPELWNRIKELPGFPVLSALAIFVAFLLYVFGYKVWNEWLGMPRWAEEWPARGEKRFWRRFFGWFWLPDQDPDSDLGGQDEWPPPQCPRCGGTLMHVTKSGALYCQRCHTVTGAGE